MEKLISRTVEMYEDDGIVPVLHSSKSYLRTSLENQWLQYKYRRRYGAIAPEPNERQQIQPDELAYSSWSKHHKSADSRPNYGIVGGSWDLEKVNWRETAIWDGLRRRFEENVPWEETSYYRKAMNKLESGDVVGYLDGPQTKENFESYLVSLEQLFDDIKHNGYDHSSLITVHIGRDGNWIVGHGNHRRVIATVVGIESVPVRIKYRHEQWQQKRQRFLDADSIEAVEDIAEYRSHPDIPDIAAE